MSDHYETKCPSCGGSDEQGCYADCPTHHITALEARVRELEAIVEQLAGTYLRDSNGGRDNFAPGGHDVARLVHLARAALNQEKQK